MQFFRRAGLFSASTLIATLFLIQTANAAPAPRGLSRNAISGVSSFGLAFSVVTAGQNDMNSVIDANNTANGANTKNLGSAYEIAGTWAYRFGGTDYAFVLRPGYFMQSQTGSGTGGDYDYKLDGFTVFPMMRLYPLENAFIHFFLQGGVGYGLLKGEIKAGPNDLKFDGSAFGAIVGMGVDFCFTESHCLTVEGNARYLPIERNTTSGGNCSGTAIDGITQCGGSQEVEHNYTDLRTTMSGIQGLIGYTMNF
ncbi:hypothetical protein [Bdellovibrio sp. HCB209]|uniref:hypothetical protein n=1 Tax=Bdellovibrio sp. HCB209 TaxID=3394354 RepID=UPI0039B3EECD